MPLIDLDIIESSLVDKDPPDNTLSFDIGIGNGLVLS